MITQAVTEGINPIIEKIDKQEKRIVCLEQAEAKKALEDKMQFWKTARITVLGVVVTFFATILLNNAISLIANTPSDNINNSEIEVKENENI